MAYHGSGAQSPINYDDAGHRLQDIPSTDVSHSLSGRIRWELLMDAVWPRARRRSGPWPALQPGSVRRLPPTQLISRAPCFRIQSNRNLRPRGLLQRSLQRWIRLLGSIRGQSRRCFWRARSCGFPVRSQRDLLYRGMAPTTSPRRLWRRRRRWPETLRDQEGQAGPGFRPECRLPRPQCHPKCHPG